MLSLARRGAITVLATAVLLVALAGVASAHEIGAAGKSVPEFVLLGFQHMLLGWDHLLFIGGVVLLAGQLRRAAQLISVFVLGHSTTLLVATLAGWRISAVLVDVVIALSLVFVGAVGLTGRPQHWRWFAIAVLGFGLVHGLGLSTRLQNLGLPTNGLVWRVLAFNLGVELGQLLAITLMVGLATLATRLLTRPLNGLTFHRVSHGMLIAAALALGVPLAVLAPGASGGNRADAIGSCTVTAITQPITGDGAHPDQKFYRPEETTPETNFAHVIGDGYIVVRYSPPLPAEQIAELQTLITRAADNRLVAGPSPNQTEPLKAINAYDTLTCATFDLPALTEFKQTWFADPRSRPSG